MAAGSGRRARAPQRGAQPGVSARRSGACEVRIAGRTIWYMNHLVHKGRAGPEVVWGLAGQASSRCELGPCNASRCQGRGDREVGGAATRLGSSPDVRAAAGRRTRGNGGFGGNSPDSRAVPGRLSVKACRTPPIRTAPWRAPGRFAERCGSCHRLCTGSERPGGNQMTTRSVGLPAVACQEMAAARRVHLITSGNPRCGCEPWLVSGRC